MCWRGPAIFEGPRSKSGERTVVSFHQPCPCVQTAFQCLKTAPPRLTIVVKKWIAFYNKYRSTLTSEMLIHVRRPDGQSLDAILHANPAPAAQVYHTPAHAHSMTIIFAQGSLLLLPPLHASLPSLCGTTLLWPVVSALQFAQECFADINCRHELMIRRALTLRSVHRRGDCSLLSTRPTVLSQSVHTIHIHNTVAKRMLAQTWGKQVFGSHNDC